MKKISLLMVLFALSACGLPPNLIDANPTQWTFKGVTIPAFNGTFRSNGSVVNQPGTILINVSEKDLVDYTNGSAFFALVNITTGERIRYTCTPSGKKCKPVSMSLGLDCIALPGWQCCDDPIHTICRGYDRRQGVSSMCTLCI